MLLRVRFNGSVKQQRHARKDSVLQTILQAKQLASGERSSIIRTAGCRKD